MVKILNLLKKDLAKIKQGDEIENSEIIFKQRVTCNGKKHTNYYLLEDRER